MSARAAVGGSGSLAALVIFKPYRGTRIDKSTGEVDAA